MASGRPKRVMRQLQKSAKMFHHEIIESEGPIWGGGHEHVDTVPSAGKRLRAGLPIGN